VRREYALKQFLPLGYVNARSIRNKIPRLQQHIESLDLDVIAITETWAKSAEDGDDLLRRACPPCYLFFHSARFTGRGGSVAIVYRDTFRSFDSEAVKAAGDCTSFELTGTMFCVNSVSIDFLVIYRPPLNCINRFFTEFTSLLERLSSSTKETMPMGDFNIHVDNVDENVQALLSSLLKSFGWCQHAKGPTHTEGHTLDLILSRVTDNLISSCNVGGIFSDHLSIEVLVRADRPVRSRKSIIFRSIKKIYATTFRSDLLELPLIQDPADDVIELMEQYDRGLASLLDKHAPLKKSVIMHDSTREFLEHGIGRKSEKEST
jgi:hypothetical protein